MPVLSVPYFTQPDKSHCQATCLKMMAAYLDRKLAQPIHHRNIYKIKETVNSGAGRPSPYHNAWANFEWWLKQEFGSYVDFKLDQTAVTDVAVATIRESIAAGFPVLVSTNHQNTNGHIILVIGVKAQGPDGLVEPPTGPVSAYWRFVCHDPYGAFDPQLGDPRHGARRFDGGVSTDSGEHGPGEAVAYNVAGIRRVREDRHSTDTFLLLRATKLHRSPVCAI